MTWGLTQYLCKLCNKKFLLKAKIRNHVKEEHYIKTDLREQYDTYYLTKNGEWILVKSRKEIIGSKKEGFVIKNKYSGED